MRAIANPRANVRDRGPSHERMQTPTLPQARATTKPSCKRVRPRTIPQTRATADPRTAPARAASPRVVPHTPPPMLPHQLEVVGDVLTAQHRPVARDAQGPRRLYHLDGRSQPRPAAGARTRAPTRAQLPHPCPLPHPLPSQGAGRLCASADHHRSHHPSNHPANHLANHPANHITQ